ncbi:hypothetical protein FA09DRAFT_327199 [Tilletiopsis washingtonensis]|uniref:Uncharacterized protein n=1 Tax=Tilletiopsis washingtonensis TaxID=58919 RepID=A0A316ZIA3_9BASI|nr:hypothetical protein FA09DRAFT_327199 [Tilletiopsis washingtonensis]PWO01250.1 hypothetical protein FA09DRAFT_327199 [Tilletiopsis washingtonensis]
MCLAIDAALAPLLRVVTAARSSFSALCAGRHGGRGAAPAEILCSRACAHAARCSAGPMLAFGHGSSLLRPTQGCGRRTPRRSLANAAAARAQRAAARAAAPKRHPPRLCARLHRR